MKLAISAGGTGGHLFPGIAVAETLMEMNGKNEIVFFGTRKGIEGRILPQRGFRLVEIEARKFAGKSTAGKLLSTVSLVLNTVKATFLLKKENPGALLSFGGYTSVPTSLAAFLLGIPIFLHEQNLEPGLANRFLSRFATSIFLSFPETEQYFQKKELYITGNPIRKIIKENKKEETKRSFSIFVVGGSRGASSINKAIIEALPFFEMEGDIRLFHQTGQADYDSVLRVYKKSTIQHDVFSFKEDIGVYYAESNIVVSRAGAMAIFEIAFFGKPAILIPYPFSAGRHQLINAKYVEGKGGGIVIENGQLNGKTLFDTILNLKNNPEVMKKMGKAMGAIYREDAEKAIVDVIYGKILKG